MSELVAVGTAPRNGPDRAGMVWIPSGVFTMGSDHHYPEEAPAHRVSVDGFWIDARPVTNADFQRFVDDTGHLTTAERAPDPADYPGADPTLLVPASAVFVRPAQPVDLRDAYRWWSYVPGADWRHPHGPGTSVHGLADHPVVHVTWDDARAYADWAGADLPTEAQWEYAARGGRDGATFAWGEGLNPDGRQLANTWQGRFPVENLRLDGYEWTSPVDAFPPNGYGLYDMIGNVWEWTSDFYAPHPGCCGPEPRSNPRGGDAAGSVDPHDPGPDTPRRVSKGGSFLCAPNYCRRYRPAARMPQAVDTSTCHLGFRCVAPPVESG